MLKKPVLFFVLLLILPVTLSAQQEKVVINANQVSLNKVLINLRERYGLNLSFDDHLLSEYSVTLKQSFNTIDKAINKLLQPFPLNYSYENDILIIWEKQKRRTSSEKKHYLKGYLKDSKTDELLIYSHIITDNKNFISDGNGFFSSVVDNNKPMHALISHLGYYILDTLLMPDTLHTIFLNPSSVNLKEIVITDKRVDFISQIGQKPGVIRLNSKVATHLPGYGDNSVFNLLRLQPGILAAGEQTNSMIIWGSYAGQSKVVFDGFTLYGLSNFNDNISSFNPLLVKDITVMKAGYDSKYGERSGGIVNVTGIDGNTKKVSGIFTINNMTINSKLEIPVSRKSALVVAFRHTYFNLYEPINYPVKSNDTTNKPEISLHIKPSYTFRDLNIKYSGKTNNNSRYFVSLYASNDIYKYKIDDEVQFRRIVKTTQEHNTQSGGSIFYGKTWKNSGSSDFLISFSSLQRSYDDDYSIEKLWNGEVNNITKLKSINRIGEVTMKVENRFPVSDTHTIEFGGGIVSNRSFLTVDTFDVNMSNINVSAARLYGYFQDVISLGSKITLKPGVRVTQAFYLKKVYVEPRLSAIYKPTTNWTFSLAWGLYNQYITRTSTIDNQGNYRYLWTVCDNIDIPVLKAMHNVAGISYSKRGYIVSLEGYYKSVTGLSRYVQHNDIITPAIYHGVGKSYGMDLMLKKDYKGSTFWVAYTLSKTEEKFDYFPNQNYRRAPQDQRHEIKIGTMINLSPFYISADYVYGSGFPITYNNQQRIEKDYPYSRLDGSATWKFLNKKIQGEIGLSILNILSTENIKFTNFEKIPINQTSSINIYAEAIPFTPTLFLKISF